MTAVTMLLIKNFTAAHFGINHADLTGPSRKAIYTKPRQIAYALCRDMTGKSFTEIGKAFRGRDHTTVMYGIKAVERSQCPELRSAFVAIKAKIHQRDMEMKSNVVNWLPLGRHRVVSRVRIAGQVGGWQ